MFWRLTSLSTSSPVESILDKENFSLEELLDEEEIIQECKALNSRLVNFLRDRAQVEQLLRYIVEEPPEDAESKRAFKFPFIACEIFTCEIDVILKTLVEEEELMNMLFSFLEPDRPHSALLAGYFSKVIICLMIRKTVPLMHYVQAHRDVLRQLVDLIGITSIMEVLVRLVGADDHVYPNFMDVMQWLSESDMLELIVDKLNPSSFPEVHANAAETLCAIARNAPSALASKLSSPSFVARIFNHALEDSDSKSVLVHSLSVCISLLDPKRSSAYSSLFHSFRNQHMYECPVPVDPETVGAMLPKLGDLLKLLTVSLDDKVLPTTYGELRPPLGKHRLKVVEFISVLLKTGNASAEKELINSGTIKRVIDLFFEYPCNNFLHHHVENIILSCLESKKDDIVDHLLRECNLIGKILQTEKNPNILADSNQPTLPAVGKRAPRVCNLGHTTRISNKILQMGNSQSCIRAYLLENTEWNEWQATTLHDRNLVENVYRWACGRPTALQDKTRDSDDDDLHDRDYDVAALANNLNQAFRYKSYGNIGTVEDPRSLAQDDEDVYFDDESAEVVISSLRLGDDQGSSLFTNSNWFAFQDERVNSEAAGTAPPERMDEINLNGTSSGGNSSSDDEVVIGEEELTVSKNSMVDTSCSKPGPPSRFPGAEPGGDGISNSGLNASNDLGFFRFETPDTEDMYGDRPLPDWVGWGEASDLQVGGSSLNPFEDNDKSDIIDASQIEFAAPNVNSPTKGEVCLPNGSPTTTGSSDGSEGSDQSQKTTAVPSLFEEDVEFVGVELEGTEKAMEQALKEGIVGEAGPLKRSVVPKVPEKENSDENGAGIKEFNDANYWRVDHEVAVLE
ncbi:serine/threonine-protein phosphatase 6 regulatory subunit 3-like isoform X1 [Cucurbita maxima]|uniref:Serine/threonine-protein phosphatase 6 regulatory subunit 3-like isoform X1 n=1 Tax=Cucurbita maxima TaxID=3661 RepID=A0A6J1JEC7_CUCMA|nr:serine/threonine-protein phosphatase 6 regulatory subunit 3-like isoform X1 [Cucurbita maxima]